MQKARAGHNARVGAPPGLEHDDILRDAVLESDGSAPPVQVTCIDYAPARHFPELDLAGADPAFWLICITLAGIMLLFFRRKRWL